MKEMIASSSTRTQPTEFGRGLGQTDWCPPLDLTLYGKSIYLRAKHNTCGVTYMKCTSRQSTPTGPLDCPKEPDRLYWAINISVMPFPLARFACYLCSLL